MLLRVRCLGLALLVLGGVLAVADPADARGRGFRVGGFRPFLAVRAPLAVPIFRARARAWHRHNRRGGNDDAPGYGGPGYDNDYPRYDRPAQPIDDLYDDPPERRWPTPKWLSVAESPHVDAGDCTAGRRWVRTPYGWHLAGGELCK